MENTRDSVSAMRAMRSALAQNKYLVDFCTLENFEEAVLTVFEQLEAFDEAPLVVNSAHLKTNEGLKEMFIVLTNSTWNLIRKYTALKKSHETLKEEKCRIANDNISLTNRMERLKETIHKKDSSLNEEKEKERQLQVKINNLTREIKREREETSKLKKQLQSKQDQHAHEIRRIELSGNKLRDQLQKTVGAYSAPSKTKAHSIGLKTEQEKKIKIYEQTINRLEENNSLMLQEINDLREELALHVNGLELHMESSGLWNRKTKT